jgi:hypothetical protein
MAIPDFNNEGFLPPAAAFAFDDDDRPIFSGHACTLAEVEERFVTAYPDSLTRAALFQQLRLLVKKAKLYLNCFEIVISGEFVIRRESPKSIFVVLDVQGENIDRLDGEAQWELDALFNGRERRYGTDEDLTVYTGIIRAYPPDHEKFEMGNAERTVQRLMASSPVPEAEASGYLEVLDCEGGLANAIFNPPAP